MQLSADTSTGQAGQTTLPSFAEAVDAHKAMVFSICWHFLRDRIAAEELAQEVFLQLHCDWKRIKSAEHLVAWLRRTTSHRAIDYARRTKRRAETSLEETGEPTALERLHDTFLTAYLARMVASLPEKQRMAVILRYGEEMEVEEIARTLDMKTTGVKTLLLRGLELLRAKTERRLGYGSEQRRMAAVREER